MGNMSPYIFNPMALAVELVQPVAANGKTSLSAEKQNVCRKSFEVTHNELTREKEAFMAGILSQYCENLVERGKNNLGYPANLDVDYSALIPFQHFLINNAGDPFSESTYSVHSRPFEIGVLDWFAHLWEIEKSEYWGYVTSGGTEGNFHGILIGREMFPDGVLYASSDSHYSVSRAAHMYRMNFVEVDTLSTGEIDYSDFKEKLLLNKGKPAIVNVNIGTTYKGAVDDLDLVIQILEECGISHEQFYIHCDGALSGLMMSFVEQPSKISFKKPIGSVTISGHKFLGCPMPCGVQITRIEHTSPISRKLEYIPSPDATFAGSRNGHAPIYLWYALNKKGYRGLSKDVQFCLRNACYLKSRLLDEGISAMVNELGNIVVFERPYDEEFIQKWQLACERNMAHIVVMPNVTTDKLNDFILEFIEKRSIWYNDERVKPPCLEADIGKNNCLCPLHR